MIRKCTEGCTCRKHVKRQVQPYHCNYCGNENLDNVLRNGRGYAQRSKCKRCINAYVHKVPWSVYAAWLAAGCAICGRKDARLEVDHDHRCCTGDWTCASCYRGLLCTRHNTVAGILEDPSAVEVLRYLHSVGSSTKLTEAG